MILVDKIIRLYFKIPRKIRFLVFYSIAFCLFWKYGHKSLTITGMDSIKDVLIAFLSLPLVLLEEFQKGNLLGAIFMLILGWGMILGYFFYFSLPITIIYFIERNVRVKIKRENGKYTPEQNIIYYRELLDDISPAVISIIDNYKIEPEKDIIAGVLKLALSGHVKMEGNNIEVVEKETDSLSPSQKHLYERIKDGKIDDIEAERWKTISYKEAVEKKYIKWIGDQKYQSVGKHYTSGVLRMTIIIVVAIVLFFISSILKLTVISMFLILFMIVFVAFYLPYLIGHGVYYLMRKSDFRYTEKGEDVKYRIEGLKRYINDYSLLNEKDKKEVVLWDDYLIYAVLFGQNRFIIRDMLKMKGLETEISFDGFSFIKDL